MAEWTVKCGMCKHSKTYSGYISVVACDFAECKFEPIVCTAKQQNGGFAERTMAGKHYKQKWRRKTNELYSNNCR